MSHGPDPQASPEGRGEPGRGVQEGASPTRCRGSTESDSEAESGIQKPPPHPCQAPRFGRLTPEAGGEAPGWAQ